MKFKKNLIKKQKIIKKSPAILNIFGIIAIISIFFLGFSIIENTKFINLDFLGKIQLNPNNTKTGSEIKINNEEIQESENSEKLVTEKNETTESKKINILVVGRGGGTHEAPNLTDTIILASINTNTNIVSMLSIPRDLYVEYDNYSGGKINQIYAINYFKTGKKEDGMIALSKKISELTGEKVDYYVNIDFNGFEKIIDILGGIELTIEEDFVDNSYPDGNYGYKTITFKKGTWIFDGENALKYARSRHSTSDFDRSLRQQQIIKAIKDKLTATYLITSPLKVKELYDTFKEYVLTNISGTDVISLAIKLNKKDYILQSANLNDSCFYGADNCEKGGFLYTPNREYFSGAAVLLPDGVDITNLSNYSELHKYTNLIFNHTDLYLENYKINIFNSVKINYLASLLADKIKKYGFNVPSQNSIGNTQKIYEKSIIYYNNIDKNSKTIKTLKEFFPEVVFKETIGAKFAKELDTKIEIVIGNDYDEIFGLNN